MVSTDPPPVRSPRELPEFREWWLALHAGETSGTSTDVTAEHAAIRSGLREGVLWYLAADALDFIDAAAETLPTEITLGPGLAPARSGLIYGNGSLLPQVRGPVIAMAWTERDEGLLLASIYLHKIGRLAMGFTIWPWGDSWHQDNNLGATVIRGQLATMWLVSQTPRAVTQSDIAPSRPQARPRRTVRSDGARLRPAWHPARRS